MGLSHSAHGRVPRLRAEPGVRTSIPWRHTPSPGSAASATACRGRGLSLGPCPGTRASVRPGAVRVIRVAVTRTAVRVEVPRVAGLVRSADSGRGGSCDRERHHGQDCGELLVLHDCLLVESMSGGAAQWARLIARLALVAFEAVRVAGVVVIATLVAGPALPAQLAGRRSATSDVAGVAQRGEGGWPNVARANMTDATCRVLLIVQPPCPQRPSPSGKLPGFGDHVRRHSLIYPLIGPTFGSPRLS